MLLTRDEFRGAVFRRDHNTCVVPTCGKLAVDAHHILERKLWVDGGYCLDNGVSLCEEHHLAAEATLLSCADLRAFAGITRIMLPDHMCDGASYDKWGNEILPNGLRLRGELFDEEGARRALSPVLHLFTGRVRYPRTFHLPWSPGATSDDRVMMDPTAVFGGAEVVVTEKMDGECTTLYRDYLHARSVEGAAHPSRARVRALHGTIGHDIPDGWRLCGENLYAVHSIRYEALPSHFLLFSIWDERNTCLPWDETVFWGSLLGLHVVPVLYRGPWDLTVMRSLDEVSVSQFGGDREGYVVRRAVRFHYRAFRRSVAKYVRKNHVMTDDHWSHKEMIVNKLQVPIARGEERS